MINNTIHDPDTSMNRLLRITNSHTSLHIVHNLISEPGISIETSDPVLVHQNWIGEDSSYFSNIAQGDLHLSNHLEEAMDHGIHMPQITDDIGGEQRDSSPDIGADEWMQKSHTRPHSQKE